MSNPIPAQTGRPLRGAQSGLFPVYQGLSTDFYPWAEVIDDLKARAQAGEHLLFVAEGGTAAGGAAAQFIWQAGRLLGGHSLSGSGAPRDLNFAALMRGLPRARVSLLGLDAEAAAALWEYRAAVGEPLQGSADEVARLLGGKTGVLRQGGSGRLSFWQAGAPQWGYWDGAAGPQAWHFMTVTPPLDREELVALWGQLLALTHRRAALDEAWRQSALSLASEYPVLDPFTREIVVRTGELTVLPDLTAEELQPAMLAAYRGALGRLRLRLGDVAAEPLISHPLWEASGLAGLLAAERAGGRL